MRYDMVWAVDNYICYLLWERGQKEKQQRFSIPRWRIIATRNVTMLLDGWLQLVSRLGHTIVTLCLACRAVLFNHRRRAETSLFTIPRDVQAEQTGICTSFHSASAGPL